jgi:hypothetical protein
MVSSVHKFCNGGSMCIFLVLNLLYCFQSHFNRVVGVVCMCLPSLSNRSMSMFWVCMVDLLVAIS